MKRFTNLMIALGITFFAFNSFAQLSAADAEALQKTQDFLKNKSDRDAFIEKSPDAQAHTNKMDQMGMNANQKQETFNISADVFGQLVKDNNGDAAAVQKILLNAQKNPEAFYKSLSPKSKEMIKGLGQDLESNLSPKEPR